MGSVCIGPTPREHCTVDSVCVGPTPQYWALHTVCVGGRYLAELSVVLLCCLVAAYPQVSTSKDRRYA
eukprot:488303-Rhodomonas_salina.1